MPEQFMGFDPLVGSEIMNLMGADASKLGIPQSYKRIQDIVQFFGGMKDYRYQILRVLDSRAARNTRGDNMEALWMFVQLQREKEAAIKELNPQDFETDIAQDIVAGHIPLEKKQRISADIEKHKGLVQKREAERLATGKEALAMVDVLTIPKLTKYEKTLETIEQLDRELSQF